MGQDGCPYKLLVIDSISAFYWNQRTEDGAGISVKDIMNVLVEIVSRGQVILVTLGWKGGQDTKFHASNKLSLDFMQFKEGTLISQAVLARSDCPATFYLHVSAHGCTFTTHM